MCVCVRVSVRVCACMWHKRKPNETAPIRKHKLEILHMLRVEKDLPSIWQLKVLLRNSIVNWFKMMSVRKSYSYFSKISDKPISLFISGVS